MKNIYKIFSTILVLSLALQGCNDYLDLPPTNERAVSSFTDVKQSFSGYLEQYSYPGTSFFNLWIGRPSFLSGPDMIMFESYSDNIDFEKAFVDSYVKTPNYEVAAGVDLEVFYSNFMLWNISESPYGIWTDYYEAIGFINGLLMKLDQVDGGTDAERDHVKGEMLAHRGYLLFKLLQYYAPYNKADMGIPVYLNTGGNVVGITNPRKSHAEVYEIILNDLNEANEIVQRTSPKEGFNIFFNKKYLNNILSQVYWFKAESPAKEPADYENAKSHSTVALEGDLGIPTSKDGIWAVWRGAASGYTAYYKESGRYATGTGAIYNAAYITATWATDYPRDIAIEKEFIDLFSTSDIRFNAYFSLNQPNRKDSTISWEFNCGNFYRGTNAGKVILFQPEEAYLILAESNYRTGNEGEALSVLNEFKGLRNAVTVDLSGEALLNEIINERRKEFFGRQDHRWLDLKRYGNKTITRTLTVKGEEYSITVDPNSYRYALPIPLEELANNPDLTANEGWDFIEF